MAYVVHTNGRLADGRPYQFIAHWAIAMGDPVQRPEWVVVPDGQPLLAVEVWSDQDELDGEN